MSRSLKTVLSLVVLVATIAAALWIVGGKRARYSTSLLIEAPPSEVFEFITDTDLMMKWVEGLVKVEPLNDLSKQVGGKARIVMEADGKQVEFDDEVIRFEENELLSVKAQNSLMTLTSIYRLKPTEDGKTYLTLVVKKAHKGIGKFMGPFMASEIQEKITNDAQRLKSIVESKPAPAESNMLNAVTPESGQTETYTSGPAEN